MHASSYWTSGPGVFVPSVEEINVGLVALALHVVIVTGFGVTRNGRSYFQIQHTAGPEWGQGGRENIDKSHFHRFYYAVPR